MQTAVWGMNQVMCLSSKSSFSRQSNKHSKGDWDGAGMVLQTEHWTKKEGGFHNEGRRQGPWEGVFALDLEGW